eukprot:CAMPEP_0198143702 /NCGR_PEP_ID=MMETSP1443-20131203/9597_1 /TAXON_ID=186043 /ORGANISM="Entomoneis sp., Strain CCMP2396" /LENGTH=288 /DNA_ID=CAMNT_0043806977 /DNA_START=183 /DNA_END=1049 /DNA_ORIENTATION=+
MRIARKSIEPGMSIGFVPTMGALHEGHLSLIQKAATENDIVVASIFVNPTQFGPNDDLDKYPRTWENDTKLLQETGVDMLFAPTKMYGDNHILYVDPTGSYFDNLPESKVRPGHFRGVATIVTKLFNIVQPDKAYFGQKDAAQCVLIRRLVDDLSMGVEIIINETVRESDGLAMSSRNAYLSTEERVSANILYRSLLAAKNLHKNHIINKHAADTLTISQIRQAVQFVLVQEPLVQEIQYVSIDDYDTMQPLADEIVISPDQRMIISLACQVGQVRLIDNIVLSPADS